MYDGAVTGTDSFQESVCVRRASLEFNGERCKQDDLNGGACKLSVYPSCHTGMKTNPMHRRTAPRCRTGRPRPKIAAE
jgi:hypothetical protein